MNLDRPSTEYIHQEMLQIESSAYSTSFPTPIGPKDTLEVVDVVSTNSLITSMDKTTTKFMRETFTSLKSFGDDRLGAWDYIPTHVNNRKISWLTNIPNTDIVDRTPDLVHSEKMLISPKLMFDDFPSRSSSTTSSKRCHWADKFEELIDFHKRFGYCLVPNNWKENVKLSQWVKRQRHQYKLRHEGKSSSLTPERIEALEDLGFVWSVQEDTWGDRFNELQAYKDIHGHTNVPKNCKKHPQLSVWVKYQRRHLRLFIAGQRSSLTADRFTKLTKLGFQWNPRQKRKGDS